MSHRDNNTCIRCSVTSCMFHSDDKNYCTLEEIKVGCSDPTVIDSSDTECASFRKSNQRG